MGKLSYRPEIDGLRALSVLMVLLFHAGLGFPGGYVGVDVFFVISGFLISGLVIKDLRADRFEFVDFWERRVRRIFPALAVMVLITLAIGSFVLLPGDFVDLAKSAVAQTLLVANFHFLENTGYFQGPADLKPLLHTWSLAVEEQFYLFFPALLVLWKRVPSKTLAIRLALLAGVSFGVSVWGTSAFPEATFYLLPMRAWELMAGAGLAVAAALGPSPLAGAALNPSPLAGAALSPSPLAGEGGQRPDEGAHVAGAIPASNLPHRQFPRECISIAGLALIAWTGISYNADTRFPGANAIAPCLGGVFFLFANTSGLTVAGRLLATAPLVFVGKISYSLYLWHWPVLAFLRHLQGELLPLKWRVAAVAFSLLLGWISWKFVETPLRRPQAMSRRAVFTLATACSFLTIGLSLGIESLDGLRFRFAPKILNILDAGQIARIPGRGIIPIGVPPQPGQDGRFLLWGDSHAQAVSELVHQLAVKHQLPGYIANRSSTVPALGTWRPNDPQADEWNASVIEFIKLHHIQNVILVSRWTINIDGRPDGSMKSLIVDDAAQSVTPAEAADVLRRGLRRTIAELKQAHVNVWLVRQVPQQRGDVPRLLAQQVLFDREDAVQSVSLQQHQHYQERVNLLLDEFADDRVVLLDPTPYCFDDQGRARMWDSDKPYYSDDHHLSRYGAQRLLQPLLEPVLLQLAEPGHVENPKPAPASRHASAPATAGLRR